MLLRRVMEHVKTQNWTAVTLDFFIVVIGVFIGIQVANWNDARSFREHERDLLKNLRTEMQQSIEDTKAMNAYYEGIGAAGRRSLLFLQNETSCTDNCWKVVVDFFHASQWVDVSVRRTTYDEMRRQGLPSSNAILSAAEAYYAQNESIGFVVNERPQYRNLVRGLIPVQAQKVLWLDCHSVDRGAEILHYECPPGINNEAARVVTAKIKNNPVIERTLTQWASLGTIAAPHFNDQIDAAQNVIAAIDDELTEN